MAQTIPVDTRTIQEILRQLKKLTRDVEEIKETVSSEYPMVDEETEKRIGESLKAYKEGKFTVLKTKKDIETFVNNL
jgi:hypothetical protein